MDIRSKLKLFNNEVLVFSESCTTEGGEVQQIFQRWEFPDGCRGAACGGYFASQEWVEACAFFKEIRACGFIYSKSCGFSVYPAAGAYLNFSCKGSFFVKACNSTIDAYCVKVNSEDVINLYTYADGCAYLNIGNYESEDQDKVGVKAYGEDIVISSRNNTSIDSGTLDISSDGELNISAGGTLHINTYCTEMKYINVSTFSTFDGGIYFKPDSSIETCGNAYFKGNITRFSNSPTIENVTITQDNQLVPKSYVDEKLSSGTYCSLFNDGLKVGKGACVVEINTDTDVIIFDETELPTTGGTVATQDYVEESMKSLPYTCIYNLGECTPVNGIASWEITLMCGDQYVASIIPPHVSILKNDPSTTLGGTYVNADVSVNIIDDVGIPSETIIKIEMNVTETVPANTFKAVVSNIYARCF